MNEKRILDIDERTVEDVRDILHRYFENGKYGDYVFNDENGKKLMRPCTGLDSLISLYAMVNDRIVAKMEHWEAIDWLLA